MVRLLRLEVNAGFKPGCKQVSSWRHKRRSHEKGKTWTAEPDQIIPRGTIPYLSLFSELQGLIWPGPFQVLLTSYETSMLVTPGENNGES